MVKASIIIATYNMGYHLKQTIDSVLTQSEHNFELIVVDDSSSDNTIKILEGIKDRRLRYIHNRKNFGVSLSRNKGIKISRGNYLFFTDADCTVSKDWLKSGLDSFQQKNCIGVGGIIYYVSKLYKPTYSDRVVESSNDGEYMTANMAYEKKILQNIGLFDKEFKRNGDRAVALKLNKYGEIKFNPNMIVYHAVSKWKPSAYMKSASWVYYRVVLMFKKFDEKYNMIFRVYAPEKLFAIVFPPILLLKLFTGRYKTKEDYVLFLLIYPRLIYERWILWKSCFKEKVFIV